MVKRQQPKTQLQVTGMTLVTLALLAGCAHQVPTVGADGGASGASDGTGADKHPAAPGGDVAKEDQPAKAGGDEPADGPVNLPPIPHAPTTPVAPSEMTIKAVAETTTIIPTPGLSQFKAALIRTKLTWTPVKGAVAGYRVYQLEKTAASADGDKGKLVFTTPKWLPFTLVGGGYGLANLKVNQEYDYTVEAVDRSGNVIASGKDNTMPLQPIDIPYLQKPGSNEQHVSQTPYFSWTPVANADGYYLEVFGTIRNTIPAIPMWRAYRAGGDSMNMLYGQMLDVMSGTRPMQWSLPLNVGSRYAWSVCAIRTYPNANSMADAKAIARATAPVGYFLP